MQQKKIACANENVEEYLSDFASAGFEEYKDFDQSTEPDDSWDPASVMSVFLERYFNHSLPDQDKDVILKEFFFKSKLSGIGGPQA